MAKKKTEHVEVIPTAIVLPDEPQTNVVPAQEASYDITMTLPRSMDLAKDTMEKFLSAASVNAVYGEPIRSGDALIIPTAEVLSGMGFGLGAGVGNNADRNEEGKPVR
jgi:hypothetical protein